VNIKKIRAIFQPQQGVDAERDRRIKLTSIMNIGSQVIQILTGLISVPMALSSVGSERFGLWMTLSSALMFINFSDFGVGIGVQDRVGRYLGENRYDLAQRAFFSGLAFVILVFCILMFAGAIIIPKLDLVSLLALKTDAAIKEIDLTVLMVLFVIGIGLIAGVIQRFFMATQEGFWVALIQAISRVFSLLLLFVVVKLQMGLPTLIFVVGGISSAFIILIGFPFLLFKHLWLMPKISSIRPSFGFNQLKEIMKVGGLGLSASIAIYLVNNTPITLISIKYGANNVVDFAILMKLLGIPLTLLIFLLSPLWSAITDAKMKGDYKWIRKTYNKYLKIVLAISLLSTVTFALFGTWIIREWTKSEANLPSLELISASIFFMLIGFWNALNSMLLNGYSKFKGQATYGLVLAIAFALIAALIPANYNKEYIIWVVSLGYFIRCIFMQIEISKIMKNPNYKEHK
jgi:O-antigen/teichoic acid export membrane protein